MKCPRCESANIVVIEASERAWDCFCSDCKVYFDFDGFYQGIDINKWDASVNSSLKVKRKE